MKKTYNYNNTMYTTLTAIAKEVGKTRIYQKDFSKYGITVNEPSVATPEDVTTTYTTVAAVTYTTVVTLTTATTYTTVNTLDETPTAPIVDAPKNPKKVGTDEEIKEVENAVVDMTRFQLGKSISGFTIEALEKMATNAGVKNLWTTISNQPIRKMRLIMEIKEAYFPIATTSKKAPVATPWKGIPTNLLTDKAKAEGITWKEDKNEGINRMRLIMALKANGIKADDVKIA